MKNLIVLFFALSASVAQADIITCTFTEPFVTTTYSMTQSSLTYKDAMTGKVKFYKNVSFQIKAAGQFELVAVDGKVLQTLTLNNQGSDGMSENIFPYSVKDNSKFMTANLGLGGCSSNHLKVKAVL